MYRRRLFWLIFWPAMVLGPAAGHGAIGTQSSPNGELIGSISFLDWEGVRYLSVYPADGQLDNFETIPDDPDTECNRQHVADSALVVVTGNDHFNTMYALILSGLASGARLKFTYRGCLSSAWYPYSPLINHVTLYAP